MIKITQELPQSQKDIILKSLLLREAHLKKLIEDFKGHSLEEEFAREVFDIKTLIGMIKYDVSVTMTEKEQGEFTAYNGVDYPEYR
jgi:hypothetical protein